MREPLHTLDLFSGIGGFSLGLERAGMKTVAFCEIEPFCRAVLAKHWPGVPCYDDIRTLTGARLAADGIVPNVICGGFPCQDLSIANPNGAGLDGARSGLWFEYRRIIEEIRPRWVIIENVARLRTRGLDQVLGGLATLGYDAEWHLIPASALGAPHRRDRVWIVAHANGRGWGVEGHECGASRVSGARQPFDSGETLAVPGCAGLQGAEQPRGQQPIVTAADLGRAVAECCWGSPESRVGGANDGVPRGAYGSRGVEEWEGETPRTIGKGYPNRRHRLMALGNAVVPPIPEMLGRAILRAEGAAP